MSHSTYGTFSMGVADTATMKNNRFVYVNSDGNVDLPDATDDAEVLAIVGTTVTQVTPAGDVAVRPIGGGKTQVTVAASETVAPGDKLVLTGNAGCVKTGNTGWVVGIACDGATSGASEPAVISAVLRNPYSVASGT
ncbi:MAG TPA: hypothetical protein PK034_09005 [Rugosibacter sp.]|nr:hypothetical protein [Rugosibacter sp.]